MKATVIRLTPKDEARIKNLRENGYGRATAEIIRRAIEDADRVEIERSNAEFLQSRF